MGWNKRLLAGEAFETATFLPAAVPGIFDIASGGFLYHGPDFVERSVIAPVERRDEYYDDFGSVKLDVTGDGQVDLITGGWWSAKLRWRRRPSDPTGLWVETDIASTGPVELVAAWDIDHDGTVEIVPNVPSGPLRSYKLIAPGDTPRWTSSSLWEGTQGHGLGWGDISGSGRGDFVLNHGWLCSQPDGGLVYRPEFDLGEFASVPILVVDVDGDGVSDLIVGNGHGYGLHWWQQTRHSPTRSTWTRRVIDDNVSQCHSMRWVDVDGDGTPELVTGKRWRAHPTGDPGTRDDLGTYIYRYDNGQWDKETVTQGAAGIGVGVGLDFDLADTTGNGLLDIVAPGKDGLWLLTNA